MAKAVDIGTCFIVGAHLRGDKEVFTRERDAFFSVDDELGDALRTVAAAPTHPDDAVAVFKIGKQFEFACLEATVEAVE